MPYDIRKSGSGYKVGKKGSSKTFSDHPLPKKTAIKQRIAINISEHKRSFDSTLKEVNDGNGRPHRHYP